MSATVRQSRNGRHWLRATQAALVALLALATVPLAQAPAAASTDTRAVTGTGCHESTSWSVQLLSAYVTESANCLAIEASSTARPYGVAVLGSTSADVGLGLPSAPGAVTVTLDCMVIEDLSWGSRVFASGADAAGTRHYVTLTAPLTYSGFVAGPANGPAPCGAWDYTAQNGVDVDGGLTPRLTAGAFQVTPPAVGSNALPTASFTHRCDGLTCTFDATGSSDPDGSVVSYRWAFGDYSFGSGATVTNTYPRHREDYQVRLTVVDNRGGAHETVRTVATNTSPAFTLAAHVLPQGKRLKVVLEWVGGLTSTVHISRDSAHLATVQNDGSHSDLPSAGTHTYQVCDATRTRCSNVVTVTV
ncbi:MAG TPA: PKD domain-containing protein [Mycobacteriales bacterium]|nr:PKD domain-containing protein [Mycobacteriales bacterium]